MPAYLDAIERKLNTGVHTHSYNIERDHQEYTNA